MTKRSCIYRLRLSKSDSCNAVKTGILPEYEIVGALGRDFSRTQEFSKYFNCKACKDIGSFWPY